MDGGNQFPQSKWAMSSRTFAICLLVQAGAACALAGSFHQIGQITPDAASADGSIIVGSRNVPCEYFTWTEATGVVGIGGACPGSGSGGQPDISNDGRRISGVYLNPANGLREMAYYDVDTAIWTPLGGMGASLDGTMSSGWGISGDGTSVVGFAWNNPPPFGTAMQWTEGGSNMSLGSTVVGASSRANSVDFDGDVVVGWQDSSAGFRQGAVWENGVQKLIFDTAGNRLGEASDVSADGQWVVGIGTNAHPEAWRWSQATGAQSLGNVFGNGAPGLASAISGDGSKIVGTYRFGPPATSGDGFIWFEGQGMLDLTAYAASRGIDTQNHRLSLPLGISADGRTVVGMGVLQGNLFPSIGWVLDLGVSGDFNNDGDYGCTDVDALVAEIVAGTNNLAFDMNVDNVVDIEDLHEWLAEAGAAEIPSGNPYLIGDANLDSIVDGSDFIVWNAHKFTANAAWCLGDFTADGFVDGADFIAWNMNKFSSATSVVPEPGVMVWQVVLLIVTAMLDRCRR